MLFFNHKNRTTSNDHYTTCLLNVPVLHVVWYGLGWGLCPVSCYTPIISFYSKHVDIWPLKLWFRESQWSDIIWDIFCLWSKFNFLTPLCLNGLVWQPCRPMWFAFNQNRLPSPGCSSIPEKRGPTFRGFWSLSVGTWSYTKVFLDTKMFLKFNMIKYPTGNWPWKEHHIDRGGKSKYSVKFTTMMQNISKNAQKCVHFKGQNGRIKLI